MRVLEQRSTKFHCLVIKCLDQSPFSEWPRIEWLNWGELKSYLPKGMGYDPQSGMGGGNIDIHTILTSLAKEKGGWRSNLQHNYYNGRI